MGTTKKISGKTMGYVILIGLVIVSWAIFKILTPHNFGSFSNMLNYFQASLIATVGAVGFYFVMVMGMFDFSIGANIMLSAIVGCVFATRFNLGYFGLIAGCIITGAIVGTLNGLFYVKLRIPSMIVTTGLALIYESVANYIAGGVEQTLPSNLRAFGQMPGDIILALVACAVAYIFLNYTKIGTYTYAIGSDEFVAKNMGINVNKYKVLAFILSGAFLGVMAILTISYGSSMVAVTGMASRVLQQIRLRQQLSLTSQSGQSEQERQLQQSRLKKFVQESVHASLKYMMKLQQKQSVSSTADL